MHIPHQPLLEPALRIGIDIGGTFTDFVVFCPESGRMETFKLLSTPHNPAEVVIQGLARIYKQWDLNDEMLVTLIHGSTVATNALLERKGARTALITTRGFRDVIQIGRQHRPDLYDLFTTIPIPLVPDELRFEITERIGPLGDIKTPLDNESLDVLYADIGSQRPESIALCLLFSFANPTHEQKIATVLREAGHQVSVSSEILPEYREYERTSTTVVNAYVSPILKKYLDTLEKSITLDTKRKGKKVTLRVMQSNGGIIRVDEARRNGVRCILSGPAGGVIGARHVARLAYLNQTLNTTIKDKFHKSLPVLTFDMGGTSTDVSLIDGDPQITTEAVVGGYPIGIPVLDIHTIGAGGGSIAVVDAGGVLRVGPESAGANPGPACYGSGDLPTVTDANLVLGRLQVEHFLGGQMHIDSNRAGRVLAEIGEQLKLDTPAKVEQAAMGVIEIVNAHMERALRVISVERGHDPRDFTLLSFGGAGGLHAVELARRLDVPRVLISPFASTLSAFGMLTADVIRDYTQTVMLPGHSPVTEVSAALEPLVTHGLRDIQAEGISPEMIVIEKMLDMRYRGQSYELTVPFGERFIIGFHEAHHRAYGTSREGADVEIVNLRVRVTGRIITPQINSRPHESTDPTPAWIERREVWFPSGPVFVPLYRGELLLPGNIIPGPAVIVYSDTTILIGIPDQAKVDGFSNLHIEIGKQQS
jgi:N-methylhydantoinase A